MSSTKTAHTGPARVESEGPEGIIIGVHPVYCYGPGGPIEVLLLFCGSKTCQWWSSRGLLANTLYTQGVKGGRNSKLTPKSNNKLMSRLMCKDHVMCNQSCKGKTSSSQLTPPEMLMKRLSIVWLNELKYFMASSGKGGFLGTETKVLALGWRWAQHEQIWTLKLEKWPKPW